MKKNILITGTGGFIGKYLKEFFAKNNKYTIYSPRSFELNCCNSTEVAQYLEKNDIDYIIHCASIGGVRGVVDDGITLKNNLLMVENLLSSKKTTTRIILFGSGAMYGKSRVLKKITENDIGNFIPLDLYGKSKMLIAQKVQGRNDCVCLNIFGCYGQGEKESRFPTYAINQNIKNNPIEINQNVIFDYLYINDLAKIIEHFLLNHPNKNIINVTPTESISLYKIAEIVNKIGLNQVPIIIKDKELGNEYTGDNTLLLKELPDFRFTSIKDGLTLLYNHLAALMP